MFCLFPPSASPCGFWRKVPFGPLRVYPHSSKDVFGIRSLSGVRHFLFLITLQCNKSQQLWVEYEIDWIGDIFPLKYLFLFSATLPQTELALFENSSKKLHLYQKLICFVLWVIRAIHLKYCITFLYESQRQRNIQYAILHACCFSLGSVILRV